MPNRLLTKLGSRLGGRPGALVATVALLLSGIMGSLGCGSHPTGPGIIPPTALAPRSYDSVVWLGSGSTIGFNHWPLGAVAYDPRTGSVSYSYVDSLRGWWRVSVSGGVATRQFGIAFRGASVSPAGDRLAAVLNTAGGPGVFVMPVLGASPDPTAATELVAGALHWWLSLSWQ